MTAWKICAICGGPIFWHYEKAVGGDRDFKTPKQNACVDCDQEGWGYAPD